MWLLPTFARPARCQDALDAIAAAEPSDGVVLADPTDWDAYSQLRTPPGWRVERRPPDLGLCEALNWAFARWPGEPWYGLTWDDGMVRTRAWTAPLVAAAGRDGFANSNDGWQCPKRMHGAIVLGGDLARALGWLAPPGLRHCYLDDAYEHLGRALRNWKHVPSVMVEHLHVWNGKGDADATHRDSYSTFAGDREAWASLLIAEIPAAITRSRALVAETRGRPNRSLFIAVPAYSGEMKCGVATMLLRAVDEMREAGWSATVQMRPGDSFLSRCRNAMVADFLATDATDFLFWDSDIVPVNGALARICSHPVDLVGGAYRHRADPEGYAIQHKERVPPEDDATRLVEVDGIGCGFMRVTRAAIERMIAFYPDLWCHHGERRIPWLFDFQIYDHYPYSEDFVFCRRWREAGGRVWVDPELPFFHVGSKSYAGRYGDYRRQMIAALTTEDDLAAARGRLADRLAEIEREEFAVAAE
jgi:hypothetical protein